MIHEHSCFIWIQGRELTDDIVEKLRQVSLSLPVKKAKTGSMVFDDPEAILFDSKVFNKKRLVAFLMGQNNELEMMGPYEIKRYQPDFPEDGSQKLTVYFQDISHRMNRKQKRKRKTGNPARLIAKVAEGYGLGYDLQDIPDLEFTDDYPLIQANQTDAALLQRLADRYGYVWGIEGINLYFRKPEDNEELGKQLEVPVLSYKINDQSLKSFAPEIKFMSKGRRKSAKKKLGNIDLLNNTDLQGAFEVGGIQEQLSDLVPSLSGLVKKASTQEGDDEEIPKNEEKKTDDADAQSLVDIVGGLFKTATKTLDSAVESPDFNEESIPGDASGAATPDNEEEAKKRIGAKVLKSSEIITGVAVPTTGSMRYKPGMSLILSGLGERCSGRYRVTQVDVVYSKESLRTPMRVSNRKYKATPKDKEKISKDTEDTETGAVDAKKPGGIGPSAGSPEKILTAVVDLVEGVFRKKTKIDGADG